MELRVRGAREAREASPERGKAVRRHASCTLAKLQSHPTWVRDNRMCAP
jgi:hypothetical protein